MLTEYKPNRPLRSLGSSQLEIPRVHTKQGESAFSYYAARSWNQLTEEIKCAKTLATFKSGLKTHLFSCAFVEWALCYVRTDCIILCIILFYLTVLNFILNQFLYTFKIPCFIIFNSLFLLLWMIISLLCKALEHKTPAKFSWAFKMVFQFGSLGYTIMGKTPDLTVVQKTIIDTLHKEGKPQTFIAKEAVHRVLYPSMLTESWVEGKSVEEKDAQPTERNRSLMRIVKQNQFKNLGKLHKEWTEAGVKASRVTTHRRVEEFGYSCRQRRLTWAKEKKNWTVAQWSKVLFSDESKFCISFGNQGPRVWRKGGEAHSTSCLKSSVKFPQSVMIWGAMSSAGVGPLCFLKTNITAHVY